MSSRSTTTISLKTFLSQCCRLIVGIPTKKESGASKNSNMSLGRTGMKGSCHVKGNINADITSATIATFATFTECMRILHSVNAAAKSSVNPSAPNNRQADAIAPPWGSDGNPFGGAVVTCKRSPSRKGIEQWTTPGMGFGKLTTLKRLSNTWDKCEEQFNEKLMTQQINSQMKDVFLQHIIQLRWSRRLAVRW